MITGFHTLYILAFIEYATLNVSSDISSVLRLGNIGNASKDAIVTEPRSGCEAFSNLW